MTLKEFFSLKDNKKVTELVNNYGFKTREDIKAAGYHYHHSSIRRGYHSRKYESVYEYSGKFGEGYIVESNNSRSNTYGIQIEYFVK